MNAAARRARNATIEKLYRGKMSQTDIGKIVGLNPPQVHRILASRGLLNEPIPRANSSTAQTIWDRDTSRYQLLRHFYNRQLAGAREARRAMETRYRAGTSE